MGDIFCIMSTKFKRATLLVSGVKRSSGEAFFVLRVRILIWETLLVSRKRGLIEDTLHLSRLRGGV
jgi:hypothetical protein